MTCGDGGTLARGARGALVAVWGAAAFAASSARADEAKVVAADVVLAPVAIDGTFPVRVQTSPAPLDGSLRVDTDLRGRLTGELTLDGRTFAVRGQATHGAKGTRVALTATSGRDRITFAGSVAGSSLSGTATGRGATAAGRHPFTIDLTSAGPLVGTIEASLTEDERGRVRGTARLVAAGDVSSLAVAGTRSRRRYALTLRFGKWFRFDGTGAPDAEDLVLDWTVRGFGTVRRGDDLALDDLVPPSGVSYPAGVAEFETEASIVPLAPLGGTAPRATFTVDPALPTGLAIDAATGAVSGTPSEVRDTGTYTVTVANFAGSTTAAFDLRTRVPRAKSFAAETRALTDDDFRHVLVRTQFGVTQTGLDRLRTQGLDPFLDAMLVFAQNGPAEAVAAPELVNAGDPPGYSGRFPSGTQLARWWSSLMMNTDNPFQERLAFFWHDHFAASAENLEGGETHFMQDYVNLFRYEGNGNLRPLLLKMARDPCMLMYLDGYRNTRTQPNENFAREFWELFTLGVDVVYTQEDIVEAARAFTGWQRSTDPQTGYVTMVFRTNQHDAGAKTVLGHTIAAQNATDDYQAVVDITLDHAPVAEFVARKLFEHFAYERPPQSLVDAMAARLRALDHDVADFLKELFRSEAFFSAASRRSLVKNPVEFTMGFIHTTGLKIQTSSLASQLGTLGQLPTQPPTVNGWPIGEQWFSAQNMADRMNAAYLVVEDTTRQNANGMNVANVLPPVGQRSAGEVVDHVAALLRVTLAAAERQRCVDYLNTAVSGSATTPVGTTSPFDASNQTHLDQRLRGLLYVLAQHPTYEVR